MNNKKRDTHTLDAAGVALGRLASDAVRLLRGKHKIDFSPHLDHGDFVVIENINDIKITGNKMDQKIYYRHSTYPGGLKQDKMKDILARKGMADIFRRAVHGMLPNNKLRPAMMKRLVIR